MWHTWKSSIQHGGVSKQGGQHRVPFSNGLPDDYLKLKSRSKWQSSHWKKMVPGSAPGAD